jgi:hypothetical protein
VFVCGTRDAESVKRERERPACRVSRVACRGPRTLTQATHASRLPNTLALPRHSQQLRHPLMDVAAGDLVFYA